MKKARENGVKAGLLRLRTIWPFPEDVVSKLAEKVEAVLMVEMNMGKMVREVERVTCGRANVVSITKIGGVIPSVNEIYEGIRRAA